jgi:hypothetical protein
MLFIFFSYIINFFLKFIIALADDFVTFEFNEENLLMVRASSSGGEKELEINKG